MRNLSLGAALLLLACDPAPPLPVDGGAADGGEADVGAIDAPVIDASADDAGLDANETIDAGAPDAYVAPDPIEVVVLDDEAPHVGARVAFLDAEGALVAYATTDAEGRASAIMAAGGTVVVTPIAETGVLRSYAWIGVEPGDVLPVIRRSARPEVPLLETTARLPDVAGTTRWQLDTLCGTSTDTFNPLAVSLRSDCTRTDVLASYFDGATLLATASALDRPLDLSGEIDLTGLRPRAAVPTTFSIANLPPSTASVRLQALVRFGTVFGGSVGAAGGAETSFSASGILPDVFGGGEVIEEARIFANGGTWVLERHAARATDIDYATSSMPVLSGLGYSPAARTLTMNTMGTGVITPDGTYLRLAAAGPSRDIEWNVFTTRDTFALITLPTEMSDAELPGEDLPAYTIFRVATPSDTADLRQRVFTLTGISDLLSGTGDLIYSFLTSAT